jgi:hypothetical protein
MKKALFHTLMLALIAGPADPAALSAQSQEAVAVITELKLNRGDVQIRLPGKKASERPAVLQSLYAGSQIQASKDASVVVLFTDGMRTVTIVEKNSPFEVKAPEAKAGQSMPAVKQVTSFLLGKKKPPTYVALAVRGGKFPPTPVSPRDTKLVTGSPTFQWMGMERQRGTVRVYGPAGLLWAANEIALTQIKYPSSAPRLKPDVEHWWEIEKKGFAPEKARFKILTPEEAKPVQEQLQSLQGVGGASRTTMAILKAGLLVSHELFHEAREILLEAIGSDPDEPTLHFLLGEVYQKTGLKNLSSEEYTEADFLMKKRP